MPQTPLTKAVTREVGLSCWLTTKFPHLIGFIRNYDSQSQVTNICILISYHKATNRVSFSNFFILFPRTLQNMKCGVFPSVATLPQRLSNLSKHLFCLIIWLQFIIPFFFFTSSGNSVGTVINLRVTDEPWLDSVQAHESRLFSKEPRSVLWPKQSPIPMG